MGTRGVLKGTESELTAVGQLSPRRHRRPGLLALGEVAAQGLTQDFSPAFTDADVIQTVQHNLCYGDAAMATRERPLLVTQDPTVVWTSVPEEEQSQLRDIYTGFSAELKVRGRRVSRRVP